MQATALMFGIPRVVDDSFGRIVRERESQVLRTAFRILGNWADAEDVAQEVFLRLHRNRDTLPEETVLGAWLYRVTVNLCFDRARAAHPSAELPVLASPDLSAEASLLLEEQKDRLMKALATLPVRERAAVTLREIEGLSTAEVAEILGSAEGTIRSQISKAISKLRLFMSEGRL